MSRLLKTLTFAGIAYGLWVWLRGVLDEPAQPVGQTESVKPAKPPKAPAASSNGGATTKATTKAELYERAQELDIEGRSKMSKAELERAIRDAG